MSSIYGHDEAVMAFLSAMRGEKMHHAWLLTGPEGVGKASAATALAKRLLCEAAGPPIAGEGLETPLDHPISKFVDAYTHPDFVLLDRLPKDPRAVREIERRDWPTDLERARSITVDQVRALGGQFALMPSFSHRRVVLVDSIDDMERAGANALLKSLEEPPQGTIFLLVSHSPGRLLPTIRSRCRQLRFAALDENAMRNVLQPHLPTANDHEVASLILAAQGSPGRALGLAGLDIGAVDEKLSAILRNGDQTNALRSSLAQSLSTKPAQRRYEAFLARAPSFVAEIARKQSGDALKATLDTWDVVRRLSESAVRQSLDPYMAVFAVASHIAALAPKDASSKA
jgi:DNA polymerase III subunit delta'